MRLNPSPIRRLIVCVDGTWFNPAGIKDSGNKGFSNVFRIHCATKEGFVDAENGRVLQIKKYWPGPGAEDGPVVKTAAGIWGLGCEEIIKEVYRFCCTETNKETDEIYMFGFSRGAYIIRAVAGLLHNMHAIKAESNDFDTDYATGLKIYSGLSGEIAPQSPGACYNFLNSKTRIPPTVKFIGCFDTVKAIKLSSLHHDISVNKSVLCYRQALALNEQRTIFKHEKLLPKRDISSDDVCGEKDGHFQDAWFLGAHSDLGGGNDHDGLSLYPLQWILSEATSMGMVLGMEERLQARNLVPDIAAILFPSGTYEVYDAFADPPITTVSYMKGPFISRNRISVTMWDIRSIHRDELYRPIFNYSIILLANLSYDQKPRQVFDNGSLIGYQRERSNGTTIHPSAYMLRDTCMNFQEAENSWGFYEDFGKARPDFVPYELQFWEDEADMVPGSLEKIRILVCGNNGTGKSTIINRVFGISPGEEEITKITHDEHGQHDINKELTHPKRPQFIVHDSRGFQVGLNNKTEDKDQNEVGKVHKFLQDRLQSLDINQRVHAIWYCVDINKTRPTELADSQLISSVQSTNSYVPLVLVLTMKDKLWDQVRSRKMEELEEESEDLDAEFISIRGVASAAADAAVEERKAMFTREFNKISKQPLLGPILTSYKKKDKDTFRQLARITTSNIDNKRVAKMFVAAQLCDVDSKVSSAITEAMSLFKAATRVSAVPIPIVGMGAQVSCGALVVKRMLRVFGYDYLNADIVWRAVKDACYSNLAAVAANIGAISLGVSAFLHFSPALPVCLAMDGIIAATAISRTARMILMFTADIILILERAYWYHTSDGHDDGLISDEDIRRASINYQQHIGGVHGRITDAVPFHSFVTILRSPDDTHNMLTAVIDEFRHKVSSKEKDKTVQRIVMRHTNRMACMHEGADIDEKTSINEKN